MLKTLEKYWPIISTLLILVLLTCLLLWPGISRPLGLGVLLVSIGMGIIFVAQRHVCAYQKGQLDRPSLARNLVVEIIGIVLTFTAVLFVAGRAAQAVGLLAGSAVESHWPGLGALAGLLSGMAMGLAVGMGIGLLVQSTWGRLVKHPRAVVGENRT
jgi:hypothetical protein